MSDILNHIEEHPQETKRLMGLDYDQLQQLIQNAERLHHEKQALLESKKVRIIAGGGGRKPKLSRGEQIILTLVYLRHMTTFQLLGIQFGVVSLQLMIHLTIGCLNCENCYHVAYLNK